MNLGLGAARFLLQAVILGLVPSAIAQIHTTPGTEERGQFFEKCESSNSGAMYFRQLSTGRFDGGQKLTADDLLHRRRLLRQMVQSKDLATCFKGVPLMELCSLISTDKPNSNPRNLKAEDFVFQKPWVVEETRGNKPSTNRFIQQTTTRGIPFRVSMPTQMSSVAINTTDDSTHWTQLRQPSPTWPIRSGNGEELWGSVSDTGRVHGAQPSTSSGQSDYSRDGLADSVVLSGSAIMDDQANVSFRPSIQVLFEMPPALKVIHQSYLTAPAANSFEEHLNIVLPRGSEEHRRISALWRRYRAYTGYPNLRKLMERYQSFGSDSNARCLDPVFGNPAELSRQVANAIDWDPRAPIRDARWQAFLIGRDEALLAWSEGASSTIEGIAQLWTILRNPEQRQAIWNRIQGEILKTGLKIGPDLLKCQAKLESNPIGAFRCMASLYATAGGIGIEAAWNLIYQGILLPVGKCVANGSKLGVTGLSSGARYTAEWLTGKEYSGWERFENTVDRKMGRVSHEESMDFAKCMGNVSFMVASSALGVAVAPAVPVVAQATQQATKTITKGVVRGAQKAASYVADDLFGVGVNSFVPNAPTPTRTGHAAADFVSQAPPASGTKAAEASLTEAATKAATDATKDAAADVVKEAATDAATDTAADAATQAAASAGSDAATQVSESAASSAASSTTASTTSGAIANQGLQYPGGRTPAQMESVLNDKALHRSVYSSHLKNSLQLSDKELAALPWDQIWDLHLKQGPGLGVIATPDGKLSAESALKVTREKVLPLVKILEDSGVPWERSRDIARSLADSGGLGLPSQNKIADSLLGVDQATASLTARKAQSTVLELQETGFRHSAGTPINPSSLDLAEEAAKDASNLAYRIDSDLQTATGSLAFGSKLNGISARSQKPGHLSLDFDSANKGSRIEIVLEAQPQSNQVKVIAREPGRSEFAKVVDLKPDEIARFMADTKRVEPHAESGTWARLSRNISGTKTTDDLIGSEGSASVILRRFQQQMEQAQSDIRRVRSTLGETRADFKTAVENYRSQLVQSVHGEQALTHSEVFNKSLLESADFAARATDEELQEFVTQLQQRSVAKSESLLKSRRRLQSSVEGMSWSTARDRPQALAALQKEREAHLRLIREQSAISGEGAAYARELELRRSRTAPVPQGQAVAKAPKLLPAPPERPLLPAPPAPLKPTEVGHYRNQLLPQKGDDLGIVPNAETGPLESIIDDSVVTRFVDSLKDVRDSPEALRAARQALLMDRPDLADKVSAEIILATSQGGTTNPGFEHLTEVFANLPKQARTPASSTTLGSFFGNVAERVFQESSELAPNEIPDSIRGLVSTIRDPVNRSTMGLGPDGEVLVTGSHGVTTLMGIPTPANSLEINLIVPSTTTYGDVISRDLLATNGGLGKIPYGNESLDLIFESQGEIEFMARNLAQGRPTLEGITNINVPFKDAFVRVSPSGKVDRVFIDDIARKNFEQKRLMLPTAHPERGFPTIQQWRDTLPPAFQNETAYTLENTLTYTSVLAARGRSAGWRIEERSAAQLQEILRILPESARPKLKEEMLLRMESDLERQALDEVLKEIGFDAAPRAQDLAADAVRNSAADIRDAARTAAHQLLGENSPLDPPPRHLVPDSVETTTPKRVPAEVNSPAATTQSTNGIQRSLPVDFTPEQFTENLAAWKKIPDTEFNQAIDVELTRAEALGTRIQKLTESKRLIDAALTSGGPEGIAEAQRLLQLQIRQIPAAELPPGGSLTNSDPARSIQTLLDQSTQQARSARKALETVEFQQRMAMLSRYADEGVIEFVDPPTNPKELWEKRIRAEHSKYPANPFSESVPVISFRVKDPSRFNILCRSGGLSSVWSTFCASRRYLSSSLNRDLFAAQSGYDTFTRFQPNKDDIYHFGGVAPQSHEGFAGFGGATQLWRSKTSNATKLIEKPVSEGGNVIRTIKTVDDVKLRDLQVQLRALYYDGDLARQSLPDMSSKLFKARNEIGHELSEIKDKLAAIKAAGGPMYADGYTGPRRATIATDLDRAVKELNDRKQLLERDLATIESEYDEILGRHQITDGPPRRPPQVTEDRPDLQPTTLILDTNLADDMTQTIGVLKDHNAAQRRNLGELIGTLNSQRPRGAGKPDIRVTDYTATWELKHNRTVSTRLDRMPALTDSELKERIALRLSKLNVGQGKAGAGDRAILAEALSAPRGAGVVPSFATADSGVFYKFRSFVPAKNQNLPPAEFAKRYFPRGFEIEIEGQKLRIIPVPSQ